MPATSLWGVAAKWPTRAPKTKLTLCLRDPQGYSCISLSMSGRILKGFRNIISFEAKPHLVFHGFAKLHSLKCSLSWCGTAKKSSELYKLDSFSPHCGSIVRELVHCYTWGHLHIVTVHGKTVGQHNRLFCQPHIHGLLKNLSWQPHWLPRLMSLLRSLQKIKLIKNPIAIFIYFYF